MGRGLTGALLIALMAVGSILLWLGIPIGLIWLAAHLVQSSQPNLGIYLGLAVAIPGLMILTARGLARLDATYARIVGAEREAYRPKYTRSMRGERASTRKTTVLDTVMVISVSVALFAFGIWFLVFAGSSLPK